MMKKILFLALGLPIICFAQNINKPSDMKLIKGIKLSSNNREVQSFWLSNKISIKEFNAFITDLKSHLDDSLTLVEYKYNSDSEKFEALISKVAHTKILSLKIDSVFARKDSKIENYYTDKKFQNYPILGVSGEMASYYCRWKVRKLNQERSEKGLPHLPNFRLPTENELTYAIQTSGQEDETTEFTEVDKGKRNKHKLYHLNASTNEWVFSSEKEHYYMLNINDNDLIKVASFRCAMPHLIQSN